MKETDIIKMEIKIAGERLLLSVPFLKQNQVREAEKRVNDLFQSQTARFPGSSPRQVLAMVAYLLASMYNELADQTESAIQLAEAVDTHLKELLKGKPKADADKNIKLVVPVVTDLFDDETWQKEVEGLAKSNIPVDVDEMPPQKGLDLREREEDDESESDRTSFFTAY